jgi:hypothetical protein
VVAVPDTGATDLASRDIVGETIAGDAAVDVSARDSNDAADVPGDPGQDNGCPVETPILLGDQCVECVANDDCWDNLCCNTLDHTCMTTSCTGDMLMCGVECECRVCCSNDDCLKYPEASGLCLSDGTCEGVLPCGGLCTDDFPVCAVVQGVEQCVQCLADADCSVTNTACRCTGDPYYNCVDESGASCGGCASGDQPS